MSLCVHVSRVTPRDVGRIESQPMTGDFAIAWVTAYSETTG